MIIILIFFFFYLQFPPRLLSIALVICLLIAVFSQITDSAQSKLHIHTYTQMQLLLYNALLAYVGLV